MKYDFEAGDARISVVATEEEMGQAAQKLIRQRACDAVAAGKRVVFWLMAAPSGFAWYDSFIRDCHEDPEFAHVVQSAHFFQFDDYRIPRGDARFPVTFRHLLEERVFNRLGSAHPGDDHVHPLELMGNTSDAITVLSYREELQTFLKDPETVVIQVKGIGMDGHWGFHGRETGIDHPAEFMEVPINRQNRIQQTLDWPQYFADLAAVPDTAVTASVALFIKADVIVDLVPQRSKLFAVLATYGTERVIPEIPSSAIKWHRDAHSFVTEAAAEALVQFRTTGTLTPEIIADLDRIWQNDEDSRQWSREILNRIHPIFT